MLAVSAALRTAPLCPDLRSRDVLRKLNEVLSLFSLAQSELSAAEIATLLRYPRSSVYRLVVQLRDAGFLDQDELTGRYRLGIRLAALGDIAARSTSLQRLVRPTLRRLTAETGETATFMVLAGREGVNVDVVDSYQPLMTPGLLGRHMPLHASAGGKALVAWLPESVRRTLIVPPLKRYTATTITDIDALWNELELSCQRGYTTVDGESLVDVVGVAAPIWNHRGEIVGAVTLGGPRSRLTPERVRDLGLAVVTACRAVSVVPAPDRGHSGGSIPAASLGG